MSLTALTVKSLLTWTSTCVPSDFVMCASYGALESTLVSTRSTVPGTLASAAARTLAATVPLSAVSVLPLRVCRPPCWPDGAWVPVVDDGAADDGAVDVAALAIAPPPMAAAQMAAPVVSLLRMVDMVLLGSGTEAAVTVPDRPEKARRAA